MAEELAVLVGGQRAGVLTQARGGVLSLTYAEGWVTTPGSMPVSLSMPLGVASHSGAVVRAYLENLLPDNDRVLERWARDFQVSPRNPFALLSHVGEDCAGAVQFVRPERIDALLAGNGGVKPLTPAGIAERLRTLRGDPSAWLLASSGQFSLAGAQAKTALYQDKGTGEWGDPSGVVPTTHIVKPAITGFDDHDLNEHLCLSAAHVAGLRAAVSQVIEFEGERAVVVERYDRVRRDEGVRRVHQEDVCQALGLLPTKKYQSDGGPTPEDVIALVRRVVAPAAVAEAEVYRFVDALAFNWIVAGTDAHAKNYSLLMAPGQIRLAPLYDLASGLPYDDMYVPRLKMAMRIGSEYRVAAVRERHWLAFAERNGLDRARVLGRVGRLVERLPAAFAEVAQGLEVGSELPRKLTEGVRVNAERCASALKSGGG